MYDLVVVGAGPAGSTFARLMGESGKKILLLDGQTEQNKKPCGGLLAPDAQKALAHFDLTLPKSVLVDPQIFSVKTMDVERRQTRYYSRHYLNIDRYAFDKWLVSLVPDSVEVLSGRCLQIRREGEAFHLTVLAGGERREISAKQIVGAEGANSLVRRTFFRDDIYRYVAIQQWYENSETENPFYSCVFDEKTSESCSWSICKDGSFIYGGCFPPKGCRTAFEKQKERLAEAYHFDFSQCIKTEACLALRPRSPRDFQTARDGAYLIGEAAGFISPSSFEGISSAILSGSILAESFLAGKGEWETGRLYRRKTGKLRRKLTLKILKRWFMYTPFVRYLIMKSGLAGISLWEQPSGTGEKPGK